MIKEFFVALIFIGSWSVSFTQTDSVQRDQDTNGLTIDQYQVVASSSQWLNSNAPLKDESVLIMSDILEDFLSLIDSLDRQEDGQRGFRVQLFSNSGPSAKTNAFDKQAEFIQENPDFPSYTLWKSPNWVLRIGDYRTRVEATQSLNLLKSQYPSAYIVSDRIRSSFQK